MNRKKEKKFEIFDPVIQLQNKIILLLFCSVSTMVFGKTTGADPAQLNLSGRLPKRGSITTTPAQKWQFALVSGNGSQGAMVFGNPSNETIFANHCRLFLPLGSREILPDLAKYIPELRKIITGKGYNAAMSFFLGKAKEQGFPGLIWTDPFHPGFELKIKQDFKGPVSGYVRTEDFQTGEVEVSWRTSKGAFHRRLFVSRPDNCIVLSITGPATGKVNCELSIPRITHKLIQSIMETTPGWITCHNIYKKGKGGYDFAVRIIPTGGTVTKNDQAISIKEASELLLLMRIEPFKKQTASNLAGLRKKLALLPASYTKLFKPHAIAHGEIFNRVTLDVGGGTDRFKSSEELLDMASKNKILPPALLEKMYDAGRYMFICSSGELPPNLQGIWTGTWKPNWSGDFTLDTNLQAAIGSGLSTNMIECMEGYYRMIESFLPDWRENAKKYYGCRGVFSGPRASNTGLHLHWGRWPGVFWTAGAGWLSHWFYDRYRYTGDKSFLAEHTVPLLKEIALFYEDFLVTDKNGKYLFIPSYSPETGCWTNATMDIAVAREVLQNLADACEALGIEKENIPKWRAMRKKMPKYRINEKGELAEWITPGRGESYGHRHCSHLYPVFQSFEFTPEKTPLLWKAAQQATRKKIYANGERSSFNRMQSGMAAAYLGMAREAYSRLAIMATGKSMYPSLITSHEPNQRIFNVDANGSIPELVNMMLVFSWPGRLDLLPALPDQLPRGELCGILARGQIIINRLKWDKPAGRINLVLTSNISQTLLLRLPLGIKITSIKITLGDAVVNKSAQPLNCRKITLQGGKTCGVKIRFEQS